MNIPFSPPYIDQDVINEVVDSLQSGWITTGPKVKALENSIEKYTGAPRVVAVNSWTSGAILTLKWLGLKPGDEVIVPAYTYCATAMSVMDAGGTPVMVDIKEDITIDVEAIRKAITPRTKAIMPVDVAGWPCDYNAIISLINEPQIKSLFSPASETQEKLGRILVISDAAHSFGATLNGKQMGITGDVNIFSLHAVKNLTSAEGGAICLNLPLPFDNDELYKLFRMLSLNGQTKDALDKSKAGGWRYDIVAHGLKINMPDVNAAIALAQLRKYDHLLSERKRVFERYSNAFKDYGWALLPPQDTDHQTSSYHLYALRFKIITEAGRNEIIQKMAEKGISANVHYIPMPMLTLFKELGHDIKNYPVSYDTYVREISLPIYPQLTNEEVDYVINSLVQAYEDVLKNA
jgi:dTDP-4-amino-4,6-dideoxygalactose transaminase